MAKETSISEKLDSLKSESGTVAEYLKKASCLFKNELNIKIWFCELIGKRWSHLAGSGVLMSAGIRGNLPGSSRFGYILEEEPADESDCNDALFALSAHIDSFFPKSHILFNVHLAIKKGGCPKTAAFLLYLYFLLSAYA